MKNVIKGFEVSKMAVPKAQANSINKGFQTYHSEHFGRIGKPPPAVKSKVVKPMGVIRKGIKGL